MLKFISLQFLAVEQAMDALFILNVCADESILTGGKIDPAKLELLPNEKKPPL